MPDRNISLSERLEPLSVCVPCPAAALGGECVLFWPHRPATGQAASVFLSKPSRTRIQ